MKKKSILLLLMGVVLAYPVARAYHAFEAMEDATAALAADQLISYQLSLWISLVLFAGISVYYKWTCKSNFFFFLTYLYILLGFGCSGFLQQQIFTNYGLPDGFDDHYTYGVFTALGGIFQAGILAGFLQASTWWFTRRWHRR